MHHLAGGAMEHNELERVSEKRVLSIQSHVVHGYVGNKSATFPLQVLGFNVDAINSVQFSNHTAYKYFAGQVLRSPQLTELIEGLRKNGLLSSYTHILTGYIGDRTFLDQVYDLVVELKRINRTICYVCDPVLGDNGTMYVPKELLPIYQKKLIPLADLITPNQYEAEWLSGVSIETETDAWKAIDELLQLGVSVVIITSVQLKSSKDLLLLAKSNGGETVRLVIPKIEANFTGTGDLFSALLLARINRSLREACEKAVSSTHVILNRTLEYALAQSGGEEPSAEQMELRLIESKRDIESPPDFTTLFGN